MSRIFLVSFLSLLIYSASAQAAKKQFTFTGAVANSLTGFVFLSYNDYTGKYVQDSSLILNGQFSFTGYINGPTVASLQSKEALISRLVDHPGYTEIFLEPGKMNTVFSKTDLKHSKTSGSLSQQDYTKYKVILDVLKKQWKSVLDSAQAFRDGINVEGNKKVYDYGLPLYVEATRQLSRQFIRQHFASPVSGYLMIYEKHHMPLDSIKIYYAHLSPNVQNGNFGKQLSAFIDKEERIAVSKPAPDFMQPDSSGKEVWLHDYKGKYVLLDVWASWCVPCREEHPFLKQAYEKYSAKGFDILSLSIDREQDREKWLTAIRKDGLTWKQVCDFKVFQNQVLNEYNLMGKGIPRNFLIDPKGNIVAMNLRGEEVEKKLSELFD